MWVSGGLAGNTSSQTRLLAALVRPCARAVAGVCVCMECAWQLGLLIVLRYTHTHTHTGGHEPLLAGPRHHIDTRLEEPGGAVLGVELLQGEVIVGVACAASGRGKGQQQWWRAGLAMRPTRRAAAVAAARLVTGGVAEGAGARQHGCCYVCVW